MKKERQKERKTKLDIHQPDFGGCGHLPVGFKDPAVVGEQSFEGVPQEVDEEEPQACCKQDGTQDYPGLR